MVVLFKVKSEEYDICHLKSYLVGIQLYQTVCGIIFKCQSYRPQAGKLYRCE